jgi:5'-nucleotidase
MKILISNDDGVYAEGIKVLADNLKKMGEVFVVAPDRNRSGASNSLTLTVPLRKKDLEKNIVSVEGTPTDCVHFALSGLLPELPDIVVSGINEGANLSDDVWYSGTVAAAMEGRFSGLPAIAISLLKPCKHYQTAAFVAKKIVKRLLANPLPADTILNVNVPDVPVEKLEGFEVVRLGKRHPDEKMQEEKDPRGHTIYWVGPVGPAADAGPGTDFHAVEHNKVSITPIVADLTCYKAFEQVSHWVNEIDEKEIID